MSISGVGFDIACGNAAVRLDVRYEDVAHRAADILAGIRRHVSFSVGRANAERVEHPVLDDAVILEGVDGPRSREALHSTVHGAGRVFGRREVLRRFTRAEMEAWLQRHGVLLAGGDLDESPMAYRRLPDVLARHAGTMRVLHTLRPFAVAMAGAGEFDPFKD